MDSRPCHCGVAGGTNLGREIGRGRCVASSYQNANECRGRRANPPGSEVLQESANSTLNSHSGRVFGYPQRWSDFRKGTSFEESQYERLSIG